MKKIFLNVLLVTAFTLSIIGCKKDGYDSYKPPVGNPDVAVQLAAGDSLAIVGTINNFRQQTGDPVNITPGVTGGRREVNWDGVPANLTNNNNFPVNFFNNTDPGGPNGRKRGLLYANNGTLLRIDSTDFSEIDASYAAQFQPFSGKRTISPVATNVTEIVFKVAGTETNAFVKSIGIVFSDVDFSYSTSVEIFDGNTSIGIAKAQPSNGKFSFVGLHSATKKITRVKITSGNAALAAGLKDVSDGGNNDLVVMDDFIYSEPVALQ